MPVDGPKETPRGEPPDLEELVATRMGEYVELWAGAAAKMTEGTYRSDDLLEDWFRFWGSVARDVTAGAAVAWRAGQSSARARPGHPSEEG